MNALITIQQSVIPSSDPLLSYLVNVYLGAVGAPPAT